MEISQFVFEQFENDGESINADGRAGAATVRLDSGDVAMSGGVIINVESEDIIIKTNELEWIDNEKTLSGGPDDVVEIERPDGTSFTGIGFSANARSRDWAFTGEVKGTYVDEDDDETGEADDSASGDASGDSSGSGEGDTSGGRPGGEGHR